MGNRNMDMKELFDAISSIAGVRAPKFPIPDPLIMMAGVAGSLYAGFSGKMPDLTMEMAKASCVGSYYSPAKAVSELGMPQTPVEVALEDSYRWLNDNGYINSK